MQFIQHRRCFSSILQRLEVFAESGVHVIGINNAGVDLGQVRINLIRNIITTQACSLA